MYKNNNDKYYRTSSFYLASFLFAKGIELTNLDKTNPRKCIFVFVNSPETESLVEFFNFAKDESSEILVDARKFIMATKLLKDKLHQEEF
jgi:hypothetical protein